MADELAEAQYDNPNNIIERPRQTEDEGQVIIESLETSIRQYHAVTGDTSKIKCDVLDA